MVVHPRLHGDRKSGVFASSSLCAILGDKHERLIEQVLLHPVEDAGCAITGIWPCDPVALCDWLSLAVEDVDDFAERHGEPFGAAGWRSATFTIQLFRPSARSDWSATNSARSASFSGLVLPSERPGSSW